MGQKQKDTRGTIKLLEKWKEASTKDGLMLSLNERGKEGKKKMIASCSYLEERISEDCKKWGVWISDMGSVQERGDWESRRKYFLKRSTSKESQLSLKRRPVKDST